MNSEMNSEDLAKYIEATDGISKPWLLLQLRLKKLQERRHTLSNEAYFQELSELQAEVIKIGQWWIGREDEVFNQGL
jgi:hypothetical protein